MASAHGWRLKSFTKFAIATIKIGPKITKGNILALGGQLIAVHSAVAKTTIIPKLKSAPYVGKWVP